MEKPHKLTTRKYVGLVRDINSRMTQMPPLFDKNQQLDESELVDSLVNKAPRSHNAMLILQGFSPETWDLATFVEHYKWADTTNNIAVYKFPASYEDSDTKRHKKRSKFKEREEMVRNVVRKNPHFIALSVVKIKVTPLGSVASSRKGLKIKTIINMEKLLQEEVQIN